MPDFTLTDMKPDQWDEVAALIHDSTNGWYQANRGFDIFPAGPDSTRLFCEVYEALDPGCCIIAESNDSPKILGSCFYHPRETHFSLGIMNVHPEAFGSGVGRAILNRIIELADLAGKPIRLVSSAMNLDSFSLYTRAGFVPRAMFQDLIIEIPESGIELDGVERDWIRDATAADVSAMGKLEQQIAGIQRERDYRYFVENENGHWHVSVLCRDETLMGWIVSIAHPASNMIGPCVARDERSAIQLLHHEINFRAGSTMVFLVPVEASELVKMAYGWGARNCEIHVGQVRGEYQPPTGVVMPTFMPETA